MKFKMIGTHTCLLVKIQPLVGVGLRGTGARLGLGVVSTPGRDLVGEDGCSGPDYDI